MTDRNTEYVLMRNRKPRNTKRYYYYDDDDDDDDDDNGDANLQVYTRLARAKAHEPQRVKYISSNGIDFGYQEKKSIVRILNLIIERYLFICYLA